MFFLLVIGREVIGWEVALMIVELPEDLLAVTEVAEAAWVLTRSRLIVMSLRDRIILSNEARSGIELMRGGLS